MIAYYNQTLSSSERRYCVTRRELLSVVKAIQHFHSYLYGRHFTVRTDHAALKWLFSFWNPEGQVARWIQRLQEYDFDIQHRPGLKHNNADALSRLPCLSLHCKHCDRLESKDRAVAPTEIKLPAQEVVPVEYVTPVRITGTTPLTTDSVLDVGRYADLRDRQLLDPDIKPILE